MKGSRRRGSRTEHSVSKEDIKVQYVVVTRMMKPNPGVNKHDLLT